MGLDDNADTNRNNEDNTDILQKNQSYNGEEQNKFVEGHVEEQEKLPKAILLRIAIALLTNWIFARK